jgi:hypothetical protein
MPDGVIPGGPAFKPSAVSCEAASAATDDGFMSVPGGPDFAGHPQPPDVPCDPIDEAWRGPEGPPGPAGPAGPQGPPGADGTGGQAVAFVGPTPPSGPVEGTLWWDSFDTLELYVWYDDGTSAQWVVGNTAQGGGTGAAGHPFTLDGGYY